METAVVEGKMKKALQTAGIKLEEGRYLVGEFRGVEEKESNGKMYPKAKFLVRDMVLKMDVRATVLPALKDIENGKMCFVSYAEFPSKDRTFTNSALLSVELL